MKRIFMSAIAILLASAAVQAQTDTTKGTRHERRDMQQRNPYGQLKLSADQQAKLKTTRDDFKKQADALKEQKLTDAERKAQMQTLREQQRTQMEAVLTPEQKTQLDRLRKDRNNGTRMNGDSSRHNDGNGLKNGKGNSGKNLQKELNLTADQQAELKALRTEYKSKADKLRSNTSLTKEQKRAAMQELAKAQQEQVKTILTKEQHEKLQTLRKERAARNTR